MTCSDVNTGISGANSTRVGIIYCKIRSNRLKIMCFKSGLHVVTSALY